MGVDVAYHIGGNFEGNGTNFGYVGGYLVMIPDVDPGMINAFDLEVRLRSQVRHIEKVKFYYKKPLEEGVDAYRMIITDDHIRDLCTTYAGRDVFDIYVERMVDETGHREVNVGDSDESDSEYDENELESESEDSDFEVGSWLSEEDREEAEEVRKQVQEAKDNLKRGVPFLCNHNGDAYKSDGSDSDDIGYYQGTDSDNETMRRKSPYPKYDRNTATPYFKTTMTFSSMKEGLVPSISTLFPSAQHRLCARHIYSNWRKKYKNPAWQSMFWQCAKASTEALFNRFKEELGKDNVEAAEAMTTIDPKHWSRAYFSTDVKCDSVDNNMSESFNSLILEARHKPIFSMLEDIRIMCMEQIAAKRLLAMEWKGAYCPKILRKLAGRAKMSRYCHIIGNGKDGYEVRYKNEDRFVVQLELAKCSCRSWELTGVPCPHAISCIICEGKDPQEFIDDCYTVERYWKTYDNVMILMNGHSAWVPSQYDPVLPPLRRKMPGRPKKNRVRSVEEKEVGIRRRRRKYTDEELMARDKNDSSKMSRVARIMTCKSCKKEGHNTRTCSLQKENQVNQGKTNGKKFQGIGVYTNIDTGRTVVDPGTASQRVLHHGSGQAADTLDSGTTRRF
ncbi:hypothetical protein LINPERPRIM_LOCUS11182 [Linum perenne]